ncbi:DnaB-like helicase C-terminal domain-containing protein [Actinoplanes sp. CA-054009]
MTGRSLFLLTLARAKFARGETGDPIPTVFQSLAAENVLIRRGQLSLIAAAPGVGKSLFAMKTVMKADSPSLYFSADTDPFTMFCRAGAITTGYTTASIEESVRSGNTRTVDAALEKMSHIRFDFAGRIEADEFDRQIRAYAYAYGEFPHIITVDNASNFDMPEAGEGYKALEDTCDYLHEIARKTGAAVIALHHVTGEYDDGITPVPMKGLRGKISKVPELILTLYRDASTGTDEVGRMYVCPVKNRTGKADPSGNFSIPLHYEPPRMMLRDLTKVGNSR